MLELPITVLQILAPDTFTLAVMVLLILIVVVFIASSVKIVREYERIVIFRLGRCVGAKGPGIVFLMPGVDRLGRVDLRERYFEVTRQTCITKDNAPVDIDLLIYCKIFDAEKSVLQVEDTHGAAHGIATTTLRSVVGDLSLDDALAKREYINEVLRKKLDEVTPRWGLKILGVEIREISPPKAVQDSMIKQMSAERTRRALVTEADGKRDAAIRIAEGEKQAAILKAEGQRQSKILDAEGYAKALDTIFQAAKGIDPKTLSLQYLDTLKALGESPATKFIFPMEFTSLLAPLREYVKKAEATKSEK